MFEIIKALILGIIEGVTEFLPISSTGHLILANEFFSFENKSFETLFNIVIQLGAILSVVVFFRRKLVPLGKNATPQSRKNAFELYKRAIVGVIPAIILGAMFSDIMDKYLFYPQVVAAALAVGGVAIILIERLRKRPRITRIAGLSYKTVLFIGLFQCLAMIPGMSRSACTIIAAMLLGCSRVVAAEFSFFLAIPTMAASSGYALLKYGGGITPFQTAVLAVGFVTAFIVALLVIRLFMGMISKSSFVPFGYYRIGLAAVVLLYFMVR